ncbi:glycosyltransferase [Marinilabiliaceae bacterium JC017]|nr:glycosyltransferase [Marinilabiliaceae bacterium JC017]
MKNQTAIAIMIRTLSIGGAEKQSILLANTLAKHFRTYLFLQYNIIDTRNEKLLDRKRLNVVTLDGNIFQKVQFIRSCIKENNIRLVFAYLTSDNLIASAATLGIHSANVFGGIRSSLLPFHKYITLKLLHQYFHKGTIFNNHAGRNAFLKKGFNPQKSHVIANCLESPFPQLKRPAHKPVNIISIGRFVEAKDYNTAIRGIEHLYKELNDPSSFHYYIIGYGPLEQEIKKQIHNHQLKSNISIIIKPKNIEKYYKNADIFLCTSIFEGLSNVIMEALNYSLPVVATNVGDNAHLVLDQTNGFIINPGKPIEVAEALKLLIRNEKTRIAFGTKGNQHLNQNYSSEQFEKKYLTLINNHLK